MKDAIFLVQAGGSLIRMDAMKYESEDLLQRLLAEYPDLLAGGQMDRTSPRRWVLIRREMGVPSVDGGSAQWSLDHLLLDQDGIPTIVEVKRASDTRIRREVVGQILDYAANGIRYWPVESLRSEFASRCAETGAQPDAVLLEQLGVENPDNFWLTVRQNLEVGRVRLVFVADVIPEELRRIIEFLNDQMQRSQVVGVEVEQYVSSDGLRTLVPRVIGNTAQSDLAKGKVNAPSYADALGSASAEARDVEGKLIAWAEGQGYRSYPIRAARRFDTSDGVRLFLLYPASNYVEFRLGTLRDVHMDAEADEILATLSRIAGVRRSGRHPSVGCRALQQTWSEFEHDFLPRYVAARVEATHRQPLAGA